MTPELADEVARLQRVANVVTPARLVVRYLPDRPPGSAPPRARVSVGTADLAPIRAPGALRGASLRISIRLGADEPSSPEFSPGVLLLGYELALVDRGETELLVYHWHPESTTSPRVDPHLHVSAALRPTSADGSRGVVPLDKLHLPTGPVPLAAFARMLVGEFGVEPRAADWAARLRPDPGPPPG